MREKSEIERFLEKTIPEPNSGCWLWIAGGRYKGYGSFRVGEKKQSAHRVSYRLFCGEVEGDLHVLHKCDVKCCVNPNHLFLGTNLDNMRDKVKKGRHVSSFGINNKSSKLDPEKVRIVRELNKNGMSERKIAKQLDVSKGSIHKILLGITWRHVT